MPMFRKKPVVIEAWEWTAKMDSGHESWPPIPVSRIDGGPPIIKTLEGDLKVSIGDWIIKGVKGEFYPCKPDIFEKTYDRVDNG